MSINPTLPVPAHQAVTPAEAKAMKDASNTKSDGFSFWDLVDIINPLQHIPVIGTLYREMTGDQIKGPARVMGGAIFGGVIGAAMGGMNAIVAQETGGSDIGELAMQKVGLSKPKSAETTQVADRKPLKDLPVIEVHPVRKEFRVTYTNENLMDQITWDSAATTMPKPKTLKALSDVDTVGKAHIPDAMLSALQKYQEMKSAG